MVELRFPGDARFDRHPLHLHVTSGHKDSWPDREVSGVAFLLFQTVVVEMTSVRALGTRLMKRHSSSRRARPQSQRYATVQPPQTPHPLTCRPLDG